MIKDPTPKQVNLILTDGFFNYLEDYNNRLMPICFLYDIEQGSINRFKVPANANHYEQRIQSRLHERISVYIRLEPETLQTIYEIRLYCISHRHEDQTPFVNYKSLRTCLRALDKYFLREVQVIFPEILTTEVFIDKRSLNRLRLEYDKTRANVKELLSQTRFKIQ